MSKNQSAGPESVAEVTAGGRCSTVPGQVRPPELLAPAGDWECARAAVENGADAIYFGLDSFNARMRAQNFTREDLPALMGFLHGRGVRGYLSFNTLVFTGELDEAEGVLRSVIAAGVDAAIVQDVGICRLIRAMSPDFPIHASTQMTITSLAGVEFARDLGCGLVVLAREVPIREITQIQAALAESRGGSLPLEVFVHGALCVAYSGQCLTSEALGGRSANRGVCAQACRLPYELVADGVPVPLGDRRYLLSPQDLVGIELLPDLVRAGVVSLKIEGRLKSPEYVANITRIYRQAIDRVCGLLRAEGEAVVEAVGVARRLQGESRYELEMAFSRGLYSGWMRGINNQELVHGRFGKKRGVYLGEVVRVSSNRVMVRLEGPLKPGDGIVFDAGRPDLEEEGGRVHAIEPCRSGGSPGESTLRFGRAVVRFARINPGDKIWKTDDPVLNHRIRLSYAGDTPRYQRPVHMRAEGRAGEPLTVATWDESGRMVQARSAVSLAVAQRHPLTEETLRRQLGRLGGTAYRLQTFENRLEGDLLVPVSELNRIRRELVVLLDEERQKPLRWSLRPVGEREKPQAMGSSDTLPAEPELAVLVRTLGQLEAVLDLGIPWVYCEFEDPKRYREAVRLFRARHRPRAWESGKGMAEAGRAGVGVEPVVFVAPPRIHKSGEDWILKQVRSSGADGYLVRNYDHLKFFEGERRIGDYSLNVANPLSAEHFMRRWGLERVTASCDLNHGQLENLLRAAPPEWFEIIVHQHMPMFHMEHCLFCAFLSKGTDYTNCGRPCDRQELRLRDRVGAEHGVKADAGCRNTVFNATAQTGAEHLRRFMARGARRFRLEFLDEPGELVTRTVRMYLQVVSGQREGAELWRELRLINHLGVTRGPMG